MPEARRYVELGWEDDFQALSDWLPEPWQVSEPDEQASVSSSKTGISFAVQAGRGMAWTRTINPVWTADFPFLEVSWDSSGGAAAPGRPIIVLSDDSTGPVTPDALNPENPLASGGGARLGPLEETGQVVFDLRDRAATDRVARISLILEAGEAPARVNLQRIAFWASDPRRPTVPPETRSPASQPVLLPPAGEPAVDQIWVPVKLPEAGALPAEWLLRALPALGQWPQESEVESAEVRFRLGDSEHAACATGVAGMERIEVTGGWRGSELALLLAVRVFGSGAPWYSAGSVRPRKEVTSPHELIVRLDYEDGTTRLHFPWSAARKAHVVDSAPQACLVPLMPGKRLVKLSVEDRMTWGQVFLLAASINKSPRPLLSGATPEAQPAAEATAAARPVVVPTRWSREGDSLVVENAWIRLVADARSGLRVRRLVLTPLNRTIISAERPEPLVEVLGPDSRPLPASLREVQAESINNGLALNLTWSLGEAPASLGLALRMEFEDAGPIRLSPALRNGGDQPAKGAVRVIRLHGCRVSEDPEDAHYLLGTRSALLGREPIQLGKEHSGGWPLPLVDLFSARGGGLGFYLADRAAFAKRLGFKQADGVADVSVLLPDLSVPAKGKLALAPVVLMPHTGDWHELLAAYRGWARETFSPPAERMSDLFYCRRDYPLGGTGYLFDVRQLAYTPDRLIEESRAGFGGLDMIDISGWAYKSTGRVGDYLTNDLGGLGELRKLVEAAHARKKKVGLYFEGYLIDRRSALAGRALPAWQLVDQKGEPRWWSGQMEFFACPAVKAWQQELAEQIATVVEETGADAAYVDQFGLGGSGKACWSPDHGHPVPSNPLREERAMLATIRKALDARAPGTGLYIEFTPPDVMMPLVDAAFDYGMSDPPAGLHPTRLPLYRYIFPELASFEMVGHGIRPVPFDVDNLHRCAFHGLGLWLKGRSRSWYTPGFRELAGRLQKVYARHGRTFRSPACEPLIPTLRPGLYANRFDGVGETIVTVYNSGYSDVSGELVRVPLPPEWRAVDLLADSPAELHRNGGSAVLSGTVEPGSVGMYLLAFYNGAAQQER